MLKALIFDIDGTLLDSVDQHARAWQQAFEHFGYEIPYPEVRYQIGKGGDKLLRTFLSEEEIARRGNALEQYREELFKSKCLAECKPFPKVPELFERLKESGLLVGLASSAKKDEVEHYENLLGVKNLVDAATAGDDVARTKPDPDMLESVRHKLGDLAPEECVFVGDSPHDGKAAQRDGMTMVGVLCGGFPERNLREAGAVQIYDDPADLLRRWDFFTAQAAGINPPPAEVCR